MGTGKRNDPNVTGQEVDIGEKIVYTTIWLVVPMRERKQATDSFFEALSKKCGQGDSGI